MVRTIKTFKGTEKERRRAIFVLIFLQTGSESKARRESGLSEKALGRIIASLAEHGDIREGQRPGRPLIYTKQVMEAAYTALVEWEEGYPTGPDLMQKLVDKGALDRCVNDDLLLYHLKRHVNKMGHILIVNSTKTVFFLTAPDVMGRVRFANMMIAKLHGQGPDCFVFVDETTYEESPHPKGEVCPSVLREGPGFGCADGLRPTRGYEMPGSGVIRNAAMRPGAAWPQLSFILTGPILSVRNIPMLQANGTCLRTSPYLV